METLNQRLLNPDTRRAAFEEVVKKYSSQIYWQIRRVVLSHDDANDVLQNTFLKAWLALDTYRGDSQISTWLYRIAANESLTFLQKQKEQVSLSDDEADIARSLIDDPYFDGDELQARLQAAIARLPEKQRIVFNMKYFQDMKYEEMSEILGTSIGALKSSYHFAVQKLKSEFEDLQGL